MLTLAFFLYFYILFVPLYFHFHVPTVGGALCRSHRNISWIQSEGAIGNQNVDFHALMPPNKMKTFRYRKLERYLICSVFLSISGTDYGFGFLEIRFSALPYFFCGEVKAIWPNRNYAKINRLDDEQEMTTLTRATRHEYFATCKTWLKRNARIINTTTEKRKPN